MAIFKLYECDAGLTIRGTNYTFLHVDDVTYEDPERTTLTRGANAGNNMGIPYVEGLKEPKITTYTIMECTKEMHDLLKDVYKTKERIDGYVISRKDGSAKNSKSAVLQQSPKQLSLNDSAESMQVQIAIASYDVDENHKS